MVDMKIKVKLKGIPGSNYSNYDVEYHRKPRDPNTLLLEVVRFLFLDNLAVFLLSLKWT